MPKPSLWQAVLHPVNSPQGKGGGGEPGGGGLGPSAAPGDAGLTRRGLFFSPGVKHVDLLLIDCGMILIKMQAGVRAPLRAALSLVGRGKASGLCFVAIVGGVSSYPPSPSEIRCDLGHRSTGLQVEAQPHPSILMGRGQEGEQTLSNFPGTKRSEQVLPLERLTEGTLAFSALHRLSLWLQ